MNREELILKWLDNNLNSQELEQFKALEDSDDLIKIDSSLQNFKAPEYNSSQELEAVLNSISNSNNQQTKTSWLKPLLRVAAILIIGLSIFYYTTTLDTTIQTQIAEKTTVDLPDGSSTLLNALSTLTLNKRDWKNSRDLELSGEAYFKVEKGSTFNVITETGTITVLGTEFNVKHRDNLFEVVCYEGSVRVKGNLKTAVLKPGDSYLILDGKYIAKEKEKLKSPNWISNKSYFKSMPFKYVLSEFERQFNVKIDAQNIDLSELYSGGFTHTNLDLALKSITLPFNLNYSIDNNTVLLSSE